MSTGSTSAPFISVTLPRCFIFGNLFCVTRIANGSISLAHTGSTPNSAPARGKPPEPSNRLPSFSVLSIRSTSHDPYGENEMDSGFDVFYTLICKNGGTYWTVQMDDSFIAADC